MRYYDVYTYESCPVEQNPDNCPSVWIWRTELVDQYDPVPEGSIRMSLEELQHYKQLHKDVYNTWVQTFADPTIHVRQKVSLAISKANDVIIKYASDNIMDGITASGKTKLIADTMRDVIFYAQSGSLHEVINALDEIVITSEMNPFLTEEKREALKNLIQEIIDEI